MTYYDALGDEGRKFALAAHQEVNQLYDGYLPYEFHLRLVVKTIKEFIGLLQVDALEAEKIINAGWNHDVVEDTFRNYNDVKKVLGIGVAELVFAVTNEKGRTRKERANAQYYQGIKDTQYATFLKLADRIGNVTYGRYISPDKGMFQVYQREQDAFEEALAGPELDQLRPMLAHLRKLLRG